VTRRWLAAGGALLILAVVTTIGGNHVAVAATGVTQPATDPVATGIGPNPSGASLRLVSQTAWVTPGAAFDLVLQAHVDGPADQVLVYVDVYTALGSRSEFARSLTTGWDGFLLSRPVRGVPLSSFTPDRSGDVHVSLPTGALVNELHLGNPGVYPVAVTLRTSGIETPIARLMTHLIATPPTVAHKLDVAWVVPVHAPPPDPAVPGSVLPADQTASQTALVDALASHTKVPLTLDATPDTLAALARTDPATVNRLGQALDGREVLASTWVPTPIPSMLADGLSNEVSLSLTRGTDALTAELGTQVTGRSWVQQGPVNQATLSWLRGVQFDRVVLPEGDLGPNPDPQGRTTVRPFEVAGADQTLVRAAVADGALSDHFVNQPDPVLAAHQLLADLAQIYGDAPNDPETRGVIVVPPTSWTPDAGFLNAFLGALETSPVLAGVQVDTFFNDVPAASGRDGGPLIRPVVSDDGTIRSVATGLLADAQRTARAQLQSVGLLLPTSDATVYPRLERMLLEIPSTDLTPIRRALGLDALARAVQAVLGQVQLPSTRTITLTARKGHLPVSVVSLSDEPLQVLLQVESDKLKFAGSGTANTASFPLTLHKGNNPIIDLTVEARTSGAFPLHLTVLTPDGAMVVARTTFTVQSTALSGVGVFLSVGAGLFLVVWWSRHAWKARRASHADERRRHAKGRPDAPASGTTMSGGSVAGPASGGRTVPVLGGGRTVGP
jgi:Family of unknown function (DUF6049)